MAKIKSYSDLQQSKKLAKILPFESVDMAYYQWKDDGHYQWKNDSHLMSPVPFVLDGMEEKENGMFEYIPCWSLASLLSVLPKIQGGKPIIALDDNYITYPHINDLHTKADNLVDACYEMIIELHKLNLL